jgi:predicted ATPase
MVGREGELEMLQRVLDRVITKRTAHLFTLLGPAGVGKSRLVREFVSGHATSATFLRGRCLSYGEGITFFPLVEIVHEAAGIERTDDVATGWSKLAALAEGVGLPPGRQPAWPSRHPYRSHPDPRRGRG